MKRKQNAVVLALTLLSLLTAAPNAQAYLDPSTGSMILSAIVGLFATLGLALKTYWYKLKALFRGPPANRKSGPREDSRAPQPPSQTQSREAAPGQSPPGDGSARRG